MPGKAGTSDRLRAVLASLETLAEATLGAVRFRWEASPLGYAPLAGLAADPAAHYHRRLKSAADRLFAPAVQPDASQQLPPSRLPALNAAHRGQGSAGPDAPLPTVKDAPLPAVKKDPGGSASGQRSAEFSAGRPSAPAAVPDQDTRLTPRLKISQDSVSDAAARILSRIAGQAQSASNTPVSEQVTVLKENPEPAGSLRRRPAGSRLAAEAGVSDAGRTMRPDSINSAAGGGGRPPNAVGRAVSDRQESSAVTKQDISSIPHGFGRSDSAMPAVLGKSSMSRSGLAAPLKLDKTVSADRLGAWAYGTLNPPFQHSGTHRSRPVDVDSQVQKEHSPRAENMIRPRERTDQAPAEIREIGIPGVHSSLLGRLVSQWQQADKGPAPVRDLAPPQADVGPLPLEPSPSQWPLSAISDMDFVRRLENVLLSESRRHGIVVEDQ